MSTKFHQTTATIYQFPRQLSSTDMRRLNDKAADQLACQRTCIEAGSGWYHEAALREADRFRKP